MKTFKHNPLPIVIPPLEQVTTPLARYYLSAEGKRYYSVTTVTGFKKRDVIEEWRKRVGEAEADRISEIAATRGTAVHNTIEKYLRNELSEQVTNFATIAKYYSELDKIDNIQMIETRMCSNIMGLAGTVDCIAEFDGVLSVIDFKTSKRRKEEFEIGHYFQQATAYTVMYKELTGKNIDQVVIIIGSDDGKCVSFVRDPKCYVKRLAQAIDNFRSKQPELESEMEAKNGLGI